MVVQINNIWDNVHKKKMFREDKPLDIFQEMKLKKGMKVLDIGCGNCRHLSYLRKKYSVRVYGVDISSLALKQNKDKKIITRCVSATRLPFKDNTFDYVYSIGTIEHTDTEKALAESYRVLKKGGIAIHTVPNFYTVWTIIRIIKKIIGRWNLGLEQSFSPNKFKSMFVKNGFSDIHWYTVGFNNYSGSIVSGFVKRIDDLFQRNFKFYGFFLHMRGVKR